MNYHFILPTHSNSLQALDLCPSASPLPCLREKNNQTNPNCVRQGPEAGDYTTTKFAHHGMAGTDLPPMDTGVEWTVGTNVEVTWQIENHHGGGYAYRLCPADQNITEECFQVSVSVFQ